MNDQTPPKATLLRRLFARNEAGVRELDSAGQRHVRRAASLCRALLSERGEASGALLARETLDSVNALRGAECAAFFDLLADEFSPDPADVARASAAYSALPSPERLIQLQKAVEPVRQELFRRINMAPGGTAGLVALRRVLLAGLNDNPHWAGVDADLSHLFSSWFNRGFLLLQRIDWRTSALVLEKLIRYEAVHEIKGWDDLRRRLQADRRCFAFFHPALPDEPLIFIEVALTRGLSDKVQDLLDPAAPVFDAAQADCAMFYSITNCQEGLRGVSFGNFLIKQVAEDLGREFPRLKTFATLSPIPGFRRWLDSQADVDELRDEVRDALKAISDPQWHLREESAGKLRTQLLRSCAHYLLNVRRRGEPLDAVARFHLGNGARLERLNWMGDTSGEGMRRSAGIMVNYVYKLDEVEDNHERYVKQQRIAASPRIALLAREYLMQRPEKNSPARTGEK